MPGIFEVCYRVILGIWDHNAGSCLKAPIVARTGSGRQASCRKLPTRPLQYSQRRWSAWTGRPCMRAVGVCQSLGHVQEVLKMEPLFLKFLQKAEDTAENLFGNFVASFCLGCSSFRISKRRLFTTVHMRTLGRPSYFHVVWLVEAWLRSLKLEAD